MEILMRGGLLFLLSCTFACQKEDPARPPVDTDVRDTDMDTDTDTDPPAGPIATGPAAALTLEVQDIVHFDATSLAPGQAYRVTLVHADNLTRNPDGTGVFVDADANGAADAGPSETVAQIWAIHGGQITPAKTFPSAGDDPNNPTGVFPIDMAMTIHVEAVGGGTVYPVVYTNAGASTFLEIDSSGVPIEPYSVGAAITVNAPPPPPMAMAPLTPTTVAVGASGTYNITGLNDAYAYRVTLVVGGNLVPDGNGGATFVDGDANGAADAGPSETIAGLSLYNGTAIAPPAKTWPEGTDDPTAPTGIFPDAGSISVTVEGIGPGTVYPVAYRNGGASTFLEIDSTTFAPIEDYTVGGAFTVQ